MPDGIQMEEFSIFWVNESSKCGILQHTLSVSHRQRCTPSLRLSTDQFATVTYPACARRASARPVPSLVDNCYTKLGKRTRSTSTSRALDCGSYTHYEWTRVHMSRLRRWKRSKGSRAKQSPAATANYLRGRCTMHSRETPKRAWSDARVRPELHT